MPDDKPKPTDPLVIYAKVRELAKEITLLIKDSPVAKLPDMESQPAIAQTFGMLVGTFAKHSGRPSGFCDIVVAECNRIMAQPIIEEPATEAETGATLTTANVAPGNQTKH